MTNHESTLKNHKLLYKSKALSSFLGSGGKSLYTYIFNISKYVS